MMGSMCFHAITAVAKLAMTTDAGPPMTTQHMGCFHHGAFLAGEAFGDGWVFISIASPVDVRGVG
jgi:hypothetical protein